MFVKGKEAVHPSLEHDFVCQVVMLLPFASQSKFADEQTWDSLQAKLKEHFQADISIFQHLSKVWACPLQGCKWSEQSLKLTSTLGESKANIKSYFTNKGKTLSADDVFNLIGAMLMSESVKVNSPEVYPMMLNALDECMSCLLYTSPSPRDGLLSRMPSSA